VSTSAPADAEVVGEIAAALEGLNQTAVRDELTQAQKRLLDLDRFVNELEGALVQSKELEELKLYKLTTQFNTYLSKLQKKKDDELDALDARLKAQTKEELEKQYFEMRTNFLNFLKQQEQLHEDTVGAMVDLIAERESKRR